MNRRYSAGKILVQGFRPGFKESFSKPVSLENTTIADLQGQDLRMKPALLHKQQRQNTKNQKNMVKKQTRDNKERVRGKE